MNGCLRNALVMLALLLPAGVAGAQEPDATLEIQEYALNKLIQEVGSLSDAGLYRPMEARLRQEFGHCEVMGSVGCPETVDGGVPAVLQGGIRLMVCTGRDETITVIPVGGHPVSWQWWVTKAYLTMRNGAMSFTAVVRSQVGNELEFTTLTAPAGLVLDTANGRIEMSISELRLPLVDKGSGGVVTEVDVAQLYSLAIPLVPRSFDLPLLDGTKRTITARVKGITPIYQAGKVVVDIDAEFAK